MRNITEFLRQLSRSKTVLVGILTTLAGVLAYLAGDDFISQYPQTVAIVIAVKGVVDVVLRFLTSLPVMEKSSLSSNVPAYRAYKYKRPR